MICISIENHSESEIYKLMLQGLFEESKKKLEAQPASVRKEFILKYLEIIGQITMTSCDWLEKFKEPMNSINLQNRILTITPEDMELYKNIETTDEISKEQRSQEAETFLKSAPLTEIGKLTNALTRINTEAKKEI